MTKRHVFSFSDCRRRYTKDGVRVYLGSLSFPEDAYDRMVDGDARAYFRAASITFMEAFQRWRAGDYSEPNRTSAQSAIRVMRKALLLDRQTRRQQASDAA